MNEKKAVHSLLAVMLACSGMVACSDVPVVSSPLAPTSAATSGSHIPRGFFVPRGNSGRNFLATICTTRHIATGSGVFGAAGGTLTFGTSSLIIPAGALRDTVTIVATVSDSTNSKVVLQPHGLQFAKSAGLLLDTSGCSMSGTPAPSVVYLSETGEVLQTIPATYNPQWRTIAAAIDHFSGYAIAF